MLGATLAHYKLVKRLGAGGMGEVYLAEDLRLKRAVALKLLPPELAHEPVRLERFRREAETLAALDHDNIVAIHSVEEAKGLHFFTMQFVEGRPLSELIPAAGLPLEEIFAIAIPIADALAAAHDKGIVHRDLKPANIMVSADGRAKLLDFGLAKLRPDPTADEASHLSTDALSRDERIMGTVPYMSPEQLEGKSLDGRADVFSLGAVIYEMACGRQPFQGDSLAALISAILTATPENLQDLRPELPHHLVRIVRHCLEKEPDRRIQSARDARNELADLRREIESREPGSSQRAAGSPIAPVGAARAARRPFALWAGAVALVLTVTAVVVTLWLQASGRQTGGNEAGRSTATGPPGFPVPEDGTASIAVLPFADLSPRQDQQYFTDGLSEELINVLARVEGLRVAARTSSFRFRDQEVGVAEIGEQLGVENLLEGGVRKAGDNLRITAQLVDVATGFHLWTRTFDRELDDVFAMQQEIAGSVALALQLQLLGDDLAGRTPRTASSEAYTRYLEARFFQVRENQDNLRKASDRFQQALALDPGFALAWAGLAVVERRQADLGYVLAPEAHLRARQAAERAIELDENLSEAHLALGSIQLGYDWDFTGADASFQRALALEPKSAAVLTQSAILASHLGRHEEGVVLSRRAIALDPLNPYSLWVHARMLHDAGLYEAVAPVIDRVLDLDPDYPYAHATVGEVLLLQGSAEAALAEMKREAHPFFRQYGLALAYRALGRREESEAALGLCIRDWQDVAAYQIAVIYAFHGKADEAFAWLDRGREQRDAGLVYSRSDPFLANLHDDPRWRPFLEDMGLAARKSGKPG